MNNRGINNELVHRPGFFFCPQDTEGLVELTLDERIDIGIAEGNYMLPLVDRNHSGQMGDLFCYLDNNNIPTHRKADAVEPTTDKTQSELDVVQPMFSNLALLKPFDFRFGDATVKKELDKLQGILPEIIETPLQSSFSMNLLKSREMPIDKRPVVFMDGLRTGRTTQALKYAINEMLLNPATPEKTGYFAFVSQDLKIDAMIELLLEIFGLPNKQALRNHIGRMNYGFTLSAVDVTGSFDQENYVKMIFGKVKGPKILVIDGSSGISHREHIDTKTLMEVYNIHTHITVLNERHSVSKRVLDSCKVITTHC